MNMAYSQVSSLFLSWGGAPGYGELRPLAKLTHEQPFSRRLLGVLYRSIMAGLFPAQYGQLSSRAKNKNGLFYILVACRTVAVAAGCHTLNKENYRVDSSRD